MRDRPIRRTPLRGDPTHRGHEHGAAYHNEIRSYAEDRLGIVTSGTWSGRQMTREDALELAEAMLPAHRRYAPDLFAEMTAMAEAAGISAAEAVIVGGFTDFVDVVRAGGGTTPEEDDCTAVLVPDGRAGGAGFLAQTWDMHDSATGHIVLLDVQPDTGLGALVFSTVGCLGQIGLNEAGIAVGINNLTAADGAIGVTWPFVVRRALQQRGLDEALACVLDAELAGAHNFLLLDAQGRGMAVEAMPSRKEVIPLAEDVLVHTNHCLVSDTAAVEAPRPEDLMASSTARLVRASRLLAAGDVDVARLVDLTRDGTVCRMAAPPYHVESCGAVIMRPGTRDLWACWGLPTENEYEHFTVPAPAQRGEAAR